MKHRNLTFILACLICLSPIDLRSQNYWGDIKKLDSLDQAADKPIFIFVHTDWCQYCMAMEQKTFQDKSLMDSLHKKFHLIKFNPEDENSFLFRGRRYSNIPTGFKQKTHQFNEFLCAGRIMTYPSIITLSIQTSPKLMASGFVSKSDLFNWLNQMNHR